MSRQETPGAIPPHIVLLTSAFPYGVEETFLVDEVRVLASRVPSITIVAETPSSTVRPLPENCRVVAVGAHGRQLPWRMPHWAWRAVIRDVARGKRSPKARSYVLRTALHYLRRASAIARVAEGSLTTLATATPVCFYSYWMDYRAIAAIALRRRFPGSIAVTRAHGFDVYEERHPHGYLPFREELLLGLDGVYPVSDAGSRHVKAICPDAKTVQTCRLGVLPLASSPKEASDRLGRLTVLSIATLVPLKRVHLLAAGLALLPSESGISWRHFGDGPLGAALMRQAKHSLRIPYTFAGRVANSDVREFLRNAAAHAVFVSTSASEGIPVSIMEAMACGIPCIATAVGGIPEIVEDASNGYLLAADPTPEDVLRAIKRYGDLPEIGRLAMRRAAFETWRRSYDADTNYNDFITRLADTMPQVS